MQTVAGPIYEFGRFQLDTAERLLRRLDGMPVPLTPRVFKTLLYLVENHRFVLDKERIMEAVWPDSIVEENNLAQAISKLRQIFGETPGSDSYIATVPGRGYHFVAEVTERMAGEVSTSNAEPPAAPAPPHKPVELRLRTDRRLLPRNAFLVMASLIAIVSLGAWLLAHYLASTASFPTGVIVSARAPISEKSVAVLPFENLADDKQNAYFATGIQDEILTRLAKIGALKVISRASTQLYSSNPSDLVKIAEQLGVAHVLEGSVQKASNAVHINVQLIRTSTGEHIWAESYDRRLDDIFSVEGEVAEKIATALNAKLTGAEQHALVEKLTDNTAAYEAYLRGRAMELRGWYSEEAKENFRRLYAEATKLDPKFVAAWARLARADALMVFLGQDATQERRDAARYALETAVALQPDSTDTLLAQAYYDYWILRDYAAAKNLFIQLRQRLPNSTEVPSALAFVSRRQGLWDESLEYSQQALALSPRDPKLLADRAWTYTIVRRFDDALKTSDKVLEIVPNDPDATACRVAILHALGNMEGAQLLVNQITPDPTNDGVMRILIQHWLLNRDYGKLIETLQSAVANFGISTMTRALYREATGFAQLRSGEIASAQSTLAAARRELEILWNHDAENSEVAAHLSFTYACLGEGTLASKAAERAIALLPVAKDAVIGPALEENLARVEAELGDKERAIVLLQKLLNTRYSSVSHRAPLTPALLCLDPSWDPLRNDPRFKQIVASIAPQRPAE
jgi:TolB-like protein/DNA-binding winged helix-turn-helix (wHTH) protein